MIAVIAFVVGVVVVGVVASLEFQIDNLNLRIRALERNAGIEVRE